MNEPNCVKRKTEEESEKFWRPWLTVLTTLVSLIVISITIYFIWFFWRDSPRNISDFGATGDYFGGLLNPLFGFFTICLLIWSLYLQTRELSLTRKAVEEQCKELALTNKTHDEKLTFDKTVYYDNMYLRDMEELKKLLEKQVFIESKAFMPDNMLPTVSSLIEALTAQSYTREALLQLSQLHNEVKYKQHKFEIWEQFVRLGASVEPFLECYEEPTYLVHTRILNYAMTQQKLLLIGLTSEKEIAPIQEVLEKFIEQWQVSSEKAEKMNAARLIRRINELKSEYAHINSSYPELKTLEH